MQRALMQFFKPENYFEVREALIQAGRQDLIGGGCDCLIPAQPPKEAIEARRRAGERRRTITTPSPTRRRARSPASAGLPNKGYRPGRKSARRQDRHRSTRAGTRVPRP